MSRAQKKDGHAYIFVVGGVMSGVGKGVATASIGRILKSKGLKVTAVKIDPYINIDAGTMNPTEHGEVFVLDDGYETDQDMGNYERFLDVDLPEANYMTTGRVYLEVIRRERNLEYKGRNVEVVPDIPLEVIRRIDNATEKAGADVTLIEIGGTIGEYQNIIFLEAARMLKFKKPQNVAIVMVSYVPMPGSIGELKTKPTQYAARSLNSVGLQADVIIARSPVALDEKRKEKIAIFCNIDKDHVISAPDVKSIYDVPINFEHDGLGNTLCEILGLEDHECDMSEWEHMAKKAHNGSKKVKIGIVGKYFDSGEFILSDAYLSVIEALKFSSYSHHVAPDISWINAKHIQDGTLSVDSLAQYDGIIVPGGFGESGIEGKIKAIQYARENKIPYFGLCYGMQLMTIEYARHVAGMDGANTTEIDPDTAYPIIDIMPDQRAKLAHKDYGGSMRLGAYPCSLVKGTIAYQAYAESQSPNYQLSNTTTISERHRHRYEVNPQFVEQLEKAGLVFSGVMKDGTLKEIAELPREVHPFMLGTQFHPELKARPLATHPLFDAFIEAAMKHQEDTHFPQE